ncbi:hypothetical protein EAO75_18625 [Streptomyces sp. uw30]|nr:hypothetical protein EAO75_18625 [Streptomyces sp. uw30]
MRPAHDCAILGLPQVLGAPDQIRVATAEFEVVALEADSVPVQRLRDDHFAWQVPAPVRPRLGLVYPAELDPLHDGGGGDDPDVGERLPDHFRCCSATNWPSTSSASRLP